MITVNDILQELEQEAQATRRVLERLPDNRLQWKPHPKSMSLGQLALHVANLPGTIAEISTAPFDVSTPTPRPEADSTAQVLEKFDASMVRARQVLEVREIQDNGELLPRSLAHRAQDLLAEFRRGLVVETPVEAEHEGIGVLLALDLHRGRITLFS